jgi:signal transduction histidine kinase/ActR/RegA family two-component response regulator
MPAFVPSSLARRFALSTAGLATGALLLTFVATWWLIDRQHEQQLKQLATKEREFHAAAVGSQLHELAGRMSEVAGSTILATALVDKAGRETYLHPFLAGIRQVNGVPVQVLLTDFDGKEIASNTAASFTTAEMAWLRSQLESGKANSAIFPAPRGFELVAVEPLAYARASSPEGALLYKVALNHLHRGELMRIEWGEPGADLDRQHLAPPIELRVPPIFETLRLRIRGPHLAASPAGGFAPEYEAIALIALLLFSVVALAGASLAKVLTRDLHELEAFSSRFIGSRLSTERAPVAGSDEVASLARAINEMLDRLNQQHTALLRERQKLTEMADALKTADRRKDEFLAMLAHELRNPLAPILAGSELMKKTPGADARLSSISDIIARQTRHMTKIVDDLLDVSRVTRGLVTLEKAPLDFTGVVSAAVDQVRPLLDSRHHEFSVEVPRHPVEIIGDYARLVQVLSNLLNNAAKYTPPFGRIRLKVVTTSRELCFSVEDNGTGVAAELMPELFDLFSQGSRTIDRAQGGLGLGLALVKTLVELHGGSVRAFSEGAGQGAQFMVRLPLPTTQGRVVPVVKPVPEPVQQVGSVRLMVVDDNADAAQTLATLLQLEGHTVRVAYDGKSALEQARQERFDVFMLDIGLPGMDGIELARNLRGMPNTRDSLLIAITGYGQPGDRAKSVAAGFDEHFVKPVHSDALRSLLAQRRHMQRYSKTA